MFKKIKGKFKSILKKADEVLDEEVLEENIKNDEIKEEKIKEEYKEEKDTEEESEELLDDKKEKKKSFFSKIFKKNKEDKNEEENKENDEIKKKELINDEKNIENDIIKIKEEEQEHTNEVEENKEDKNEGKEEESKEGDKKEGFFSKAFKKLKTKRITEEDFEKIWLDIEIYLLEINIAFEIVEKIKDKLKENLIEQEFTRFKLKKTIQETLIKEIKDYLKDREKDLIEDIRELKKEKNIIKILVLGVNGTGKTTTIGKLIYKFKKEGLKTVVAASDTFRAAAIEQLEEHSKKLGFKLIKHSKGSDPAAVAFDAIKHAESKDLDIVLIDTAGRMANNSNLINELLKIKKVISPDLIILVGDSNSGNDLKEQIHLFDKFLGLNGIILTKVDTDERPGSIVTTAYSIEKPIYYLGYGQNYEDLIEFNSKEIAKKLFDYDDEENNENK